MTFIIITNHVKLSFFSTRMFCSMFFILLCSIQHIVNSVIFHFVMFSSAYLLNQKTKKNFVLQWALTTKRIIEDSNLSSRNISNHKLSFIVVRFVIELRNLLSELITSKIESCQKHLWRLLFEFIAQRSREILSMLYKCNRFFCVESYIRVVDFFIFVISSFVVKKKKKKMRCVIYINVSQRCDFHF